MADSLVEIVNTSLTSTQLPDSSTSYNLITTNSTTSYVIKSIQVNTVLDDLQASINGFPVGNWAENLTGSEIIDVNSTVSVKSANFPVSSFIIHAGDNFFSEDYGLINNSSVKKVTTDLTGLPSRLNANSINRSTFFVSGDYKYQILDEVNNTQNIRGWDAGNALIINISGSYMPVYPALEQDAIFYKDGNALKKITLSTGVITTIDASSFANASTSTYKRQDYCNGWAFLLRSASFEQSIFAVNVANGNYINFTNLQSMTSYNDYADLAVSYDEATDYFYVYRKNATTTGSIFKDILPITRTQMNSTSDNNNYTTASTGRSFMSAYQTKLPIGNAYSSGIYAHPTIGDKFFSTNNSDGFSVSVCTYSSESFQKIISRTAECGASLQGYSPTTTQAVDFYGANPEAIQIRITGVKTTT